MHNCNSPYIISFYGAFMVDGRDDVVMCLEYMDCGFVLEEIISICS